MKMEWYKTELNDYSIPPDKNVGGESIILILLNHNWRDYKITVEN